MVGIVDLLKETTVETIKRLPDGCSAEDIMYEINFVAQVLEGLKDAEAGRLLTTEELLTRVDQWGKQDGRKGPAVTCIQFVISLLRIQRHMHYDS